MGTVSLSYLIQLRNELSRKIQTTSDDYSRSFYIAQHNLTLKLIEKANGL